MNQDIWMNGRWHAGRGAAFESICPATGEAVWQGAAADAQQVTLAVEAAKAAFLGWSQQTFAQRRDILLQYAENISEQKDRIALAISRDMGKPLWEAQVEAGAMSAKVAISIQSYQERTGEQITGSLSLRHKPHGVMAVFGPFNFPGHLPNGHIVPSLLAGNCVVFKPSELTPSVAQIMVECFANAGLPDGVFNIIQGGRDTGAALLNAEIDGLLFTGSAETGIAFHRHFAGRPEVMLALEMGGNNPLIVTEDAKIEAAADIAFMSGFITSGQRCSCARRLIVPEGKYGDEVIEAIIARIQAVKIGAWHEDVFMGPVVSVKAAQAALNFEAMLVKLGGKALHGLERLRPDSAFLRPGLIDTTDADVPDQELFGPLMQIIRVIILKFGKPLNRRLKLVY